MKTKSTITLLTLALMFCGSMMAQAQSIVDPDPATQNILVRTDFDDVADTLRQDVAATYNAPPLDPTGPFFPGPDQGDPDLTTLWNGSGPPNPGDFEALTDGNGYLRLRDADGPGAGNDCCGNMDCANIIMAPNYFTEPEVGAGAPPDSNAILVWECWLRFNTLSQANPMYPRAWWGLTDFVQEGPDHGLKTHGWAFGTGSALGGGSHTNTLGVSIFPVPVGEVGAYESSLAEFFAGVTFTDGQDIGTRIILIPTMDPVSPSCAATLRYEYNLTGTGPGTGSWIEAAPSGDNAATLTGQSCADSTGHPNHDINNGVGVQFFNRLSIRVANSECGGANHEEVLVNHVSIYEAQIQGPPNTVDDWVLYVE